MFAFFLQLWAAFGVAFKRLFTQRSLALATSAGLTVAVALVLGVPLYADAAHFLLLRERLVDGQGAADYAPLSFLFNYDGPRRDGPQWADAQAVDRYLSGALSAELGLPQTRLVRRFHTESFQLYPPLDPDNPKTQYFVGWFSFGFVSDASRNIQLVSGSFPGEADLSPAAPVEVLISEKMAGELVIQPGDLFYARQDDLEIPVRVAGIWAPADPLLPVWDSKSTEVMLVPEETFANRIAPVVADELTDCNWLVVMSGSRLHASNVPPLLARIEAVQQNAAALLAKTSLKQSPLKELESYAKDAPALTFLLYAFSAPILTLVLVFIGLVSEQFVNQQRNEIAILRSRGATTLQVAGMTAVQGALLGGLALLAGIPGGELVALAIGRARSFLDFSTPAKLRIGLTPQILAFGVAAVGAVVLFQFIVPTLNAARNTVVTYKQERARAVRAPWWQRVYLDFLLLIPAGYGAYLLYQQRALAAAEKIKVPDPLRNPQLLLAPALGIFALTLFTLRVLPHLIAALAWALARTRSVGLLLATRYLSRTPAFYSAPLVLLVFTLSLSAFIASIALTLDRHLYKQMYYTTGADLRIYEESSAIVQNGMAAWTYQPVEEHLRLPGVRAATRVGRHKAIVLKADGHQEDAVFIGIDRLTFPQVAYWQRNFAPASLGALLNALAGYPEGVLVSRPYLNAQNLKLGDTVTLGVNAGEASVGMTLKIVGVLDLFPTWYPEQGPLFVGNLDAFYDQAGQEFPRWVWLKTRPGTDPEDVVYAVRGYSILLDQKADQSRLVEDGLNTIVKDWASAERSIVNEQRRPERQGLFGLLSVGFLAAALLTVMGFLLYALFSFRRRFIELGMLRAVGLSAGQMTALLAGELVFLVAIGLLVGTALGTCFSSWFIPYLQVGAEMTAHYPPFLVEIAWASIFQMYALFGLLFAAALGILVALLLRMKIFQAVKLGETT